MEKHKNLENKGMSRRRFLSVMAGAGVVGAAATMTGCAPVSDPSGTGWLPNQYRNASAMPAQVKGRVPLDPENVSLVRNDEKCILCGQCIEACEKVQSVFGYYELPVHDDFICVHCGQCSLWCPTGAIAERSAIEDVWNAIQDPETTVIVQTSPATRVGIGEEFGMGAGAWAEGQMVTALRQLGFDVVVDTNFSADLTIMEEGSELVERVTKGGVLPQLTSCCPGWVKFVEYYYPELIPNLSSARSPMMMHGSTLKTYNAKKLGITDPKKIVNVAIMPCLAKKFEISRHQFHGLEGGAGKYYEDDTINDMDYVLSVRELANMIRQKLGDVDFASFEEGQYDQIGSTAGLIFGNTGGVMEAAVRSAYYLITGNNPPTSLYHLEPVRGLDGIKRASVDVPGVGPVKVVVASGLANARQLCEEIKSGKADFHFLEVMACPGGCIAGGGQPRTAVPPQDWVRQARTDTMYNRDAVGTIKGTAAGEGAGQDDVKTMDLRLSHANPQITEIYNEFLEAPLSHLAHELCHTTYEDRSGSLTRKEV